MTELEMGASRTFLLQAIPMRISGIQGCIPSTDIIIPHVAENFPNLIQFAHVDQSGSDGAFAGSIEVLDKGDLPEHLQQDSKNIYIRGTDFFFGIHTFNVATERAEELLTSRQNLSGKPLEWKMPGQNINQKIVEQLQTGYMLLDALLGSYNSSLEMESADKKMDGLSHYWNHSFKGIMSEICWEYN